MLEGLTGRRTYGVLPFAHGLGIDEEDGLRVSLRGAVRESVVAPPVGEDVLRVAVCAVPLMSNFTDVDALAAEPGVVVRFVDRAEELVDADLVIVGHARDREGPGVAARARTGRRAGAAGGGGPSRAGHLRRLPAAGRAHRGRHRGRRPGRWTGSGCCRSVCGSPSGRHWRGRPAARWASRSKGTRSITGSPTCWAASPSWTAAGWGRSGAPTGTVRWRATRFRRAFLREVAAAAGRRFVPAPDTSFGALREEQLDRLGDLIEEHADTDALMRLIESGAPSGLPFIAPGAPA